VIDDYLAPPSRVETITTPPSTVASLKSDLITLGEIAPDITESHIMYAYKFLGCDNKTVVSREVYYNFFSVIMTVNRAE
jgi:hypothetical protein